MKTKNKEEHKLSVAPDISINLQNIDAKNSARVITEKLIDFLANRVKEYMGGR